MSTKLTSLIKKIRKSNEEWNKLEEGLSKHDREVIINALEETRKAMTRNPRQANYTNTLKNSKTSSKKGGKKKRKTQKRRK